MSNEQAGPYTVAFHELRNVYCVVGPSGQYFVGPKECQCRNMARFFNETFAAGQRAADAELVKVCEELESLAANVYDTIPTSYDENDAGVKAHASALNALGQFFVGRNGNALNPARAALAKHKEAQ